MKKKLLLTMIAGVVAIAFLGIQTASAGYMTYEFTINGADLMGYVTADGDVDSTAVEAGLDEGARLYRGDTSNPGFKRSYWASQKSSFTEWADNKTDRLADFNLWGYDGNGAKWGEIYKVYDWPKVPTTSDANWAGYLTDWPWGSFDDYAAGKPNYGARYNDGQLLGWGTDSWDNGLAFGANSYPTFTFQMTLNMDDPAFYGNTSPWYNGEEGKLALWFGGSMMDENDNWLGVYEGNIILQGSPVPEPATMLLFGLGLLGLAGVSRKKR